MLRVAVLVKQVPVGPELSLGDDGRLKRQGVDLEMNAYCRRAVAKGVELARTTGGTCIVFTLGPPTAEDVLREAVAWGADRGILLTDPAFAGSDTLATSRALAMAIDNESPFDLVLAGRNSIDADTGQVGPGVAELLNWPFIAGVRELAIEGRIATARCESDDSWRMVTVQMPAVLSVAERLTHPCKAPAEERAAVPHERVRAVSATELGPGPWGIGASRTVVESVRLIKVARRCVVLEGPVAGQITQAVDALRAWGALDAVSQRPPAVTVVAAAELDSASQPAGVSEPTIASGVPGHSGPAAQTIVVIAEPERTGLTEELIAEGRRLGDSVGARVVVAGPLLPRADWLSAAGADVAVDLHGAEVEEDVAEGLTTWCHLVRPWAVLAPGTLWGREVASRLAVRLDAGLTGDVIGLEVSDARLVCYKPAFGGKVVAAIMATSETQLATVRPGVLRTDRVRRPPRQLPVETLYVTPKGRVAVRAEERYDDIQPFLTASALVAVGAGVAPGDYPRLGPLLAALNAQLAATRRVTDQGWLPRTRQVGVTGHSVAPDLYVAIGLSGKANHMIGSRSAGTVVAVNSDPTAPVFGWSDLGIVADWRDAVPLLASEINDVLIRTDGCTHLGEAR